MPNNDLTDKELLRLSKKPPEKKKYIRERRGFAVRVMPSGAITFLHIYTIKGKRREDNLGHYPHTSLAEARRKHRANLDKLEDGTDPQAFPATEAQAPLTVESLVKEYSEWSSMNLKNTEGIRTIKKDILPVWKDRLAASIRRADAISLVEAVASRAKGQGRNVRKYGSAMFTYALHREYVESNPFIGVSAAVPIIAPNQRDRALSDDEIKELWHNSTISERAKIALLLILTTGQRPGEVVGMHTSEIDGDWWTIPKERIKTEKKRPVDHRVYLSPLAKRLIESLGHMEGYAGFLFPDRQGKSAMRENTLSHAVSCERKDKSGGVTRPAYLGFPAWTPHDLRRTCSTNLARMKAPFEYREAILNHAQQGMDAVYNVYKYDDEKKEWLTKWAEYLEQLVGDFEIKEKFELDVNTLTKLVWRKPLTEIAKEYGVSEASVRKRCNKFGISRPPQGYWLRTDAQNSNSVID